MFSRFRILVAVSILAILVFAAIGCGSSGPKSAVENFMSAAKDKNCEKMIDAIDLTAFETSGVPINKQELVDACKEESNLGDVVSYKILEETENGDKATVKVEVTTNSNGKEQTETSTLQLNKRDGEWKISTL